MAGFDDFGGFGGFGPSASQIQTLKPWQQDISPSDMEEEEWRLLRRGMGTVGYFLESLDKPARAIRGIGKALHHSLDWNPSTVPEWSEAAAFIPFSDKMGLTDPINKVGGRELVELMGVPKNKYQGLESFKHPADLAGDLAGFGLEVIADPLFAMSGIGKGFREGRHLLRAAGLEGAMTRRAAGTAKKAGPLQKGARATSLEDSVMTALWRNPAISEDDLFRIASSAQDEGADFFKFARGWAKKRKINPDSMMPVVAGSNGKPVQLTIDQAEAITKAKMQGKPLPADMANEFFDATKVSDAAGRIHQADHQITDFIKGVADEGGEVSTMRIPVEGMGANPRTMSLAYGPGPKEARLGSMLKIHHPLTPRKWTAHLGTTSPAARKAAGIIDNMGEWSRHGNPIGRGFGGTFEYAAGNLARRGGQLVKRQLDARMDRMHGAEAGAATSRLVSRFHTNEFGDLVTDADVQRWSDFGSVAEVPAEEMERLRLMKMDRILTNSDEAVWDSIDEFAELDAVPELKERMFQGVAENRGFRDGVRSEIERRGMDVSEFKGPDFWHSPRHTHEIFSDVSGRPVKQATTRSTASDLARHEAFRAFPTTPLNDMSINRALMADIADEMLDAGRGKEWLSQKHLVPDIDSSKPIQDIWDSGAAQKFSDATGLPVPPRPSPVAPGDLRSPIFLSGPARSATHVPTNRTTRLKWDADLEAMYDTAGAMAKGEMPPDWLKMMNDGKLDPNVYAARLQQYPRIVDQAAPGVRNSNWRPRGTENEIMAQVKGANRYISEYAGAVRQHLDDTLSAADGAVSYARHMRRTNPELRDYQTIFTSPVKNWAKYLHDEFQRLNSLSIIEDTIAANARYKTGYGRRISNIGETGEHTDKSVRGAETTIEDFFAGFGEADTPGSMTTMTKGKAAGYDMHGHPIIPEKGVLEINPKAKARILQRMANRTDIQVPKPDQFGNFSQEQVQELDNMWKNLVVDDELAQDLLGSSNILSLGEVGSRAMDYVDEVLRAWKTSQTSPWMSFHGRNAQSGLIMAMIGRATNPRYGNRPDQVIKGMIELSRINAAIMRGDFEDPVLKALGDIPAANGDWRVGVEMVRRGLSQNNVYSTTLGRSELSVMQRRRVVPTEAEELETVVQSMPGHVPKTFWGGRVGAGLKETGRQLRGKRGPGELQPGLVTGDTFGKGPVGRKLGNVVEGARAYSRMGQDVGDWVEGMNRGVPFTAYMLRGWQPNAAARRAKFLNVDYSRMTEYERKIFKRVMPFYAFTKGMIPVVFQQFAERPGGLQTQLFRMQTYLRPDSTGFLPSHLANGMAIPIGNQDAEGKQSYMLGFDAPYEAVTDIIDIEPTLTDTVFETAENIAGMLHPAILRPIEKWKGEQFFSGRDIRDLNTNIGQILEQMNRVMTRNGESVLPYGLQDWMENGTIGQWLRRVATDPNIKFLTEWSTSSMPGSRGLSSAKRWTRQAADIKEGWITKEDADAMSVPELLAFLSQTFIGWRMTEVNVEEGRLYGIQEHRRKAMENIPGAKVFETLSLPDDVKERATPQETHWMQMEKVYRKRQKEIKERRNRESMR